MRDFLWRVFTQSGDVDTYLLYKATENQSNEHQQDANQNNETEVQQANQSLNSSLED